MNSSLNSSRHFFTIAVPIVLAGALNLTAADVTANGPELLPGKGLAEHDFFYAGEGKEERMFIIRKGEIAWSYTHPGKGEISDAVLLPNGNVLFAHQFGLTEINQDRKVVWNLDAPPGTEIHTAQPLDPERVWYVQNGNPAKFIVIQKTTGKTEREFDLPVKDPRGTHGQFRHARLTAAGTIVVAHMDLGKAVEYGLDGKELWSVNVPGIWSATPLSNGNVLVVSTRKFVRELNRQGKTVWEWTSADAPEYNLSSLQLAVRLPNGNTIINNWFNEWSGVVDTNHPPIQAIEVTPEKKVVWALRSWTAPALGPATTIQVLDGASAAGAQNPIIWADVPDMSIIRAGDAYYMSSTTMHLSPGLPIMKSKDLVNWQIVGYAYDTLGDNDALTLQNGRYAYGAGSWASSLRQHDGTFYVSTFSSTTGKTHVYSTRDIEKGPWTEHSFRPLLHDHSLFFDDDGRVYMVHGAGNIRLTELTANVSGIKQGGLDQVIITNASRVAGPNVGLPAEGSQLWKLHGKYYLFNITWPRGGMRTVIVHRADKITGPYEGRVALQDKGVAQGGLIDTPQGDWYAYLFRDFGAVGRVPYLVPVTWKDGWPVLGVDGRVPDTLNLPASKGLLPGIVASDEFDRSPGDPALPLVWQWNHNPDPKLCSVTEQPGFLRLTTGRVDPQFLSARNTLTQRTLGPECSGTTAIDVTHMKDGDFAGLALLQKQYGLVGAKSVDGTNAIVMVSATSGSPVEVQTIPLNQTTVYLKAECDFKDRADKARFFYSLDGKAWTPIGSELKMAYTLPHFMGYRFALFNYATKTPGGFVDFDYFRVKDKMTGRN